MGVEIESCADGGQQVSWEELIQRLVQIFDADSVNVEEVEELLARYRSNPRDWRKFAKFDKYKYTRNLVHEGNGNFNLMLLCWAEGNQSTIHDHANAHCFVKVLGGSLRETRYHWPSEQKSDDGSMCCSRVADCKNNDVTYMSDELGLHRVENPSHSEKAVSLHLYSPPFKACNIFDERTCGQVKVPMTFWSKFGKKVSQKHLVKSKTSFNLVPAAAGETKAPAVVPNLKEEEEEQEEEEGNRILDRVADLKI